MGEYGKISIVIIAVYKLPNGPKAEFCETLNEFLDIIFEKDYEIVIAGGFNINLKVSRKWVSFAILLIIINRLLETGILPVDWKKLMVTPVLLEALLFIVHIKDIENVMENAR